MTDEQAALVERMEAWAQMVASGYEVPAAAQCMYEAAATITALQARVGEWQTVALGAGALLETNVRTKSRDDAAEQCMIVLIRNTARATLGDAT